MTDNSAQYTKHILRNEHIAARQKRDQHTIKQVSLLACARAYKLLDWSSIRRVHTYTPRRGSGEIDTAPLLRMLPPHVTVTSVAAQAGAPLPTGQFDVIIVPVVGFSPDNYRLGMGGGFYDRFLSGQEHATTIGLAYESSYDTRIPHESHDVPLDMIATEDAVHRRSGHTETA